MSDVRFTPGPWSLERDGTPMARNRVWPVTGRDPICQLSSRSSMPADICPEAQANGHLIAAAPDLYAALLDMFALMDEGWLVRETWDDGKPDFAIRQFPFVQRLAKANTALSKAQPAKSGEPK